jgi:hypothetical protein
MKTLIAGSNWMLGPAMTRRSMVREILLVCGILSSLLYVGSDILAAMLWEGYSYTDQMVSELRAIGAPTRPLLVPVLTVYTVLEIAFGVGVWGSAGRKRALRVTGGLLIGLALVDLVAPFFPMQLRGTEFAFTDAMHIIFTIVTVLLILLIMGVGATAFGKRFRLYSIMTILVLVAFGALAGSAGPRVAADLPTPWVGIYQRINIYSYMLWVVVLAVALLRAQGDGPKMASVGEGNP